MPTAYLGPLLNLSSFHVLNIAYTLLYTSTSLLTLLPTHAPKMDPSNNHHTQINMLVLVRAKSLTKVTDHAVLYKSLSSITKTDTLSKKRASS